MAKERVIESDEEAFDILGIKAPVTPEGEEVTTPNPENDEVQAKPAPKPEKQEPQPEDTSSEEVGEVSTPEEKSGEKKESIQMVDEEEKRRSWQSEADRAKNEATILKEQIRLLQEQNRQLTSVLNPFLSKYGGEQPAQEASEPEEDFISDGYFDPAKFKSYQRKRDEWLAGSIEKRVTSRWEERQQQQSTQKQLEDVAREFPDLLNPIDGTIDVQRVQREIEGYTKGKTIVDLLREARGIGKKPDQVLQNSMDAIKRNANKPSSVTVSPESEKEKPEVPEEVRQIHKTFGYVDLPPDYDGVKKE